MADGVTIRIKGVDEVIRKAQAARKKIRARVQAVIKTYAHKIEAEARDRCPEEPDGLRESIRTELEELAARVFTTHEAAVRVHEGTATEAARPFMLEAYERHKNDFINDVKKALQGD